MEIEMLPRSPSWESGAVALGLSVCAQSPPSKAINALIVPILLMEAVPPFFWASGIVTLLAPTLPRRFPVSFSRLLKTRASPNRYEKCYPKICRTRYALHCTHWASGIPLGKLALRLDSAHRLVRTLKLIG